MLSAPDQSAQVTVTLRPVPPAGITSLLLRLHRLSARQPCSQRLDVALAALPVPRHAHDHIEASLAPRVDLAQQKTEVTDLLVSFVRFPCPETTEQRAVRRGTDVRRRRRLEKRCAGRDPPVAPAHRPVRVPSRTELRGTQATGEREVSETATTASRRSPACGAGPFRRSGPEHRSARDSSISTRPRVSQGGSLALGSVLGKRPATCCSPQGNCRHRRLERLPMAARRPGGAIRWGAWSRWRARSWLAGAAQLVKDARVRAAQRVPSQDPARQAPGRGTPHPR
jgi:hypothetical protein